MGLLALALIASAWVAAGLYSTGGLAGPDPDDIRETWSVHNINAIRSAAETYVQAWLAGDYAAVEAALSTRTRSAWSPPAASGSGTT